MPIFITGGAGFIGRNTIPALLQQGNSVVALQRHHEVHPTRHELLRTVTGSLSQISDELRNSLQQCRTILHLAGSTTPVSSANTPSLDVRESLLPTLNLLEAAESGCVRRLIFASSGGTVYGRPLYTPIDEDHPTRPTSHYGVNKLAAEHSVRVWAESRGVEYVILRISNPYGPHQHLRGGQGVIGSWIRSALEGRPLPVWGDGTVVRDYIYIDDLVAAIQAACTHSSLPSGVYNVGAAQGNSLLDISGAIARTVGRSLPLQFTASRPYDVPINILDNRRIRSAVGWSPLVPLEAGIQKTLSWMQSESESIAPNSTLIDRPKALPPAVSQCADAPTPTVTPQIIQQINDSSHSLYIRPTV